MKRLLLAVAIVFGLSLTVNAQTIKGNMTLTATVTDATPAIGDTECGVASVQFFLGSTALGAPITAPTTGNNYVFQWDTRNTANGNYVLTAKATDKAGLDGACDGTKPNVGVSNAINVAINNIPPDVTAPTVTITITISIN